MKIKSYVNKTPYFVILTIYSNSKVSSVKVNRSIKFKNEVDLISVYITQDKTLRCTKCRGKGWIFNGFGSDTCTYCNGLGKEKEDK